MAMALDVGQLVLALVRGLSDAAAEAWCLTQGAGPKAAQRAVADARRRIVLAANYDASLELGKAKTRLEQIFTAARQEKDLRTALAAQRELNKLLGLYGDDEDAHADGAPADAAEQLELIGGYLLPLALADADYPLAEHARLAGERIRATGHCTA